MNSHYGGHWRVVLYRDRAIDQTNDMIIIIVVFAVVVGSPNTSRKSWELAWLAIITIDLAAPNSSDPLH
jgi:hypothetical protein